MGDVDNPRVWLNATVYVADLATTAPTDLTTAWPAGWEELGLLSDDGLTEARDQTVNDHRSWGGHLVRKTISNESRTITVTALEDNPVVFDLRNPGSTQETTTGVTTREVNTRTANPKAFGLELVDGDITRRMVIPRGEVINPGQEVASSSAMTMYELPIEVYPVAGNFYVEITDNPATVVPTP